MKTRFQGLLAAAGALAVPLFFTVASAGDPGPPPEAAAAAVSLDGGVDADAEADADAGPLPLPAYDVAPFAEERSAAPKAKEWAAAPRVALDRARPGLFADTTSPTGSLCEARRLREWVRLRCNITTGAISLLGGNVDGLALRLDPVNVEDFQAFPNGGEVVFPVRRGDRRVVEWLEIAFGYKGMTSVEPRFVLSEQWPAGDERPMIVAE